MVAIVSGPRASGSVCSSTACSLMPVRWVTSPSGVTMAEKPVGAACSVHRPGLDGPQPRRRDLLGLHHGEPVRRAVGRVQQHLAAVGDGVAGPVGEEHLPRDDHAHGADRGVEHGRAGAGARRRGRAGPRRSPASRSISPRSGTYSPNGHDPHLVVAVAHACRRGCRRSAALRKCLSLMPSVTPTIERACRAAGPGPRARRPPGCPASRPSTRHDVLGPQHEVDGLGDRARWPARWRSNTSRASVSAARVRCGPPPCTSATRSGPTSWPRGATRARPHEHDERRAAMPPATRQSRSHAADRATPPATTSTTTRYAPSSRAVWPSGAAAWLMARLPSGTPPNGKVQRATSASRNAPGSASQRAAARRARARRPRRSRRRRARRRRRSRAR